MLLQCTLFMVILATSFSSMMIGIVTKDAVILSSNNVFSKNGVAMRGDYDWIKQLGDNCLVGVQGDSSDCDFLISQLESSNRDHQMTFGRSLSCRSVANLCRRIIAKFLRSNQLKISVLIAGWDSSKDLPLLFWLDSIGAIQEVPYAAHGEGFSFVLGLLDRSNRQKQRLITDTLSATEDLPIATSDVVATATETAVEYGSQTDLISSEIKSKSNIMLSMAQKKKRGSLHLMTVDEGVTVIRSCMDAARKRTLGSLGSCRIKGVTGHGCIDLGPA